jgi:DNA-binding IclR family transcriptional regulator
VLDRAVGILNAIGGGGPLSLAQLVDATGLPRPTAHRLAVALEAHGLVRRDDDGRFRFGGRLVGWGAAAGRSWPLVEAAQPVLDRLRDSTGESAQLFVPDGDRRLCIASSERTSGLRDTVPLGASLPIDRGSGGTVLRAFAGARGKRHAEVRERGWAESVGEREPGVASVSAPVLGHAGEPIGAISVSGPVDRLGRQPGRRLAAKVVAAARELESAVRE